MLDFALRVHADHFQELANAQVECLFVHRVLRNSDARTYRQNRMIDEFPSNWYPHASGFSGPLLGLMWRAALSPASPRGIRACATAASPVPNSIPTQTESAAAAT